MEGKDMFCSKCGTQLPDGSAFCSACGANLNDGASASQSVELERLYKIAREAKERGDATTAKKYYDMILAADPLNWEPVFYSVYFTYGTMKNGEIGSKALEIQSCLDTALRMVEDLEDAEEKERALLDLKQSVEGIAVLLQAASLNFFYSLPFSAQLTDDNFARAVRISEILCIMGGALRESYREEAVSLYKQAINMVEMKDNGRHKLIFKENSIDSAVRDKIIGLADFIRQTEPEYLSAGEKWRKEMQERKENKEKNGGCYVATCVYGSYDCPEVWTLRRYRDDTLGSTWYGRAFIRLYYAISPTLVKWFGHTAWFKKMWKGKLDRMVQGLQANGVASTPYTDRDWHK